MKGDFGGKTTAGPRFEKQNCKSGGGQRLYDSDNNDKLKQDSRLNVVK